MITSHRNPKVKYVHRLQTERRFRRRERVFVVEGTRWVAELAGMTTTAPTNVFFTQAWADTAAHTTILHQLRAPIQAVSEDVLASMSDLDAPPGVLAVVPQPELPLPVHPTLLLILDAIHTPGNLGTMLRTAHAVAADGVLLGPGCVDPFNPKVVRGSMGALLRLPVLAADWVELAQMTAGMAVWAAVVGAEAVLYTAVPWRKPAALLIGSEAQGISDSGLQLASGRLTIPMGADTESLNAAVAAGVILFEAVRQRGEWKSIGRVR